MCIHTLYWYSFTFEGNKETADDEDRIARDFFADPSEYANGEGSEKLYEDDTCQPIGFNLYIENKKLWWSGKAILCYNLLQAKIIHLLRKIKNGTKYV